MSPESQDNNRQIAFRAIGGAISTAVRRPLDLRFDLVREGWSTVKRFGAKEIRSAEIREVPSVRDAVIEGYIDDPNRSVIAALCRGLNAKTFLEIGTNRGRTTWTVARNNPQLEEIVTIDLPTEGAAQPALDVNVSDQALIQEEDLRGEAFRETEEAKRITQLWGDSANYDFTPYYGRIDVVFIDGAHSYSYVKSDTELAQRLLTPNGTIIWDDYPAIPGVYRVLTDLAPTLTPRPFHIKGTRLAVYSHAEMVVPLSPRQRAQVTEA